MSERIIITKAPLKEGWGQEFWIAAAFDEKRMTQIQVEAVSKSSILGNIYIGRVENIATNIQAAFVDIAKAGKITGRHKNLDKGRQVYAFGAGTQKMYDYLNNNPECMAAPVEYTNDIRSISAIDNFISINNAIDCDLFGQVNAESAGIKHISGTGGQLDFAMGAYLSKGGKSFICMSSTVTGKDGTVKSRIVPTLTPGSICTDPRSCTHYIVTEYGMVNLKGLSTWQRAEALIGIAHPDFREQLIADAEKMHIWRRSNK